MKRLVLVFLLVVLGTIRVIGQNLVGQSCAEFDNNRTISEMEDILVMDGFYYDNLRTSYADAINFSVGKNIISPTKDGMKYVFKNTKFFDSDFVVPSDFENGVKYGNRVKFTSLPGQPSKNWASFTFEGIDYIYAKVSCMNPQKAKKMGFYKEKIVIKETVDSRQSETTTGSHNVVDNGKPKPKPNLGNLNPTPKKEKKEIKIGKIVLRVGEGGLIVAAVVFIVKSLLHNNHHHDGGEPGGAPVTPPAPVIPPVVIPPAGGPGGAPTTP